MRKHPLIALTAFTALSASAIAGGATGTFQSTFLTSARLDHPVEAIVRDLYGASLAYGMPSPSDRFLAVRESARLSALSKRRPEPLGRRLHHLVRRVPASVDIPLTTQPQPVVTTTWAPPPPAGGVWYELRMCESGDNYAENTGNGYYGAYQFSLSTWYGLGFTGLPSNASPATQDRAAEELQAEAGWGQWPACSAELGL